MPGEREAFDFDALIVSIRQAHSQLSAQAGKAVNVSLTLRNWLIGAYIREYEQNGTDRAKYGTTLLETLADRLSNTGIKSVSARSLRLYRQFYLIYPEIRQTLTANSSSQEGNHDQFR
ncbi:MAG: DUF1016 family protein [Candidatus Omnitrophota bacterium]|jgi:hypothetical protein|nr:MAG: DUF1016 family protein [Candidatus Omnitrophota bacterium]